MSGIYGIYRYDGAPVDPQWLERMKVAMAYYGPHGQGRMIDGPVGMGHLLLEVNPEDAFEKQPVRGERGLAVSAARLDNRDALLETFDISASEAARLTDGHLVSMAFDRWGEEVCPHLQGDWALAAWDPRERRLLLTRDAFGNSTLYYYEGKGFIAFASSMKALLALPGIVKEPDLLRLAEVLVAWQHDAELTAYKGFRRLVWSHAMMVGSDGQTRLWRHWSPEGRELLKYKRDEEYEEAFLEHYTWSVRSCLRTQKSVAAELSSGRDSGSVVALAAPVLASQGRSLTAYTSVPYLPPDGASERQTGNEWQVAHETATMAGTNVRHIPVDAANHGVKEGIEHLLDVHDGPSHAASNHYWLQAIMETASRHGAAGILTGYLGNATVSWDGNGSALLALLQGYPGTAVRLFLQAEPNSWLTLKRQILKPLLTPAQRAFRRLKTPMDKPWRAYSALNLQLASKLGIDGRMRAAGHDPTFTFSPLQDSRLLFFSPDFSIGTSISAELAARHSLSLLNPTLNLVMLEFLLRVPDDQFCRRGRSSLIKRTFRNRLPDLVLKGQRRGLQAADVGHRILRELPAFRQCLSSLDSLPEARDILDMPLLHRCLEDLVVKVDPGTTERASLILLRGLGVGIFLRRLNDSRM
jgi:asparagine synthase (glutamine-hydrolysing)